MIVHELEMLSRVQGHSHICKLFGTFMRVRSKCKDDAEGSSEHFGGHELCWAIAMECCKRDLYQAIKMRGSLSEVLAKQISGQILSGLEYVHSKQIVHRDVKPQNILCTEGRLAVLADFGVSALVSEKTSMEKCCGTPGYMAPELFQGESYGGRADIFSLGVTLYFMLEAAVLFRGQSVRETLHQNAKCEVEQTLAKFMDTGLLCHDFLVATLAKKQKERPTASEALAHPWFENSGDCDNASDQVPVPHPREISTSPSGPSQQAQGYGAHQEVAQAPTLSRSSLAEARAAVQGAAVSWMRKRLPSALSSSSRSLNSSFESADVALRAWQSSQSRPSTPGSAFKPVQPKSPRTRPARPRPRPGNASRTRKRDQPENKDGLRNPVPPRSSSSIRSPSGSENESNSQMSGSSEDASAFSLDKLVTGIKGKITRNASDPALQGIQSRSSGSRGDHQSEDDSSIGIWEPHAFFRGERGLKFKSMGRRAVQARPREDNEDPALIPGVEANASSEIDAESDSSWHTLLSSRFLSQQRSRSRSGSRSASSRSASSSSDPRSPSLSSKRSIHLDMEDDPAILVPSLLNAEMLGANGVPQMERQRTARSARQEASREAALQVRSSASPASSSSLAMSSQNRGSQASQPRQAASVVLSEDSRSYSSHSHVEDSASRRRYEFRPADYHAATPSYQFDGNYDREDILADDEPDVSGVLSRKSGASVESVPLSPRRLEAEQPEGSMISPASKAIPAPPALAPRPSQVYASTPLRGRLPFAALANTWGRLRGRSSNS